MSQEPALTEMNAVALVETAIEDHACFKKVGLRLEEMDANERATNKLIAAYNRQRCEPWLTAFLLGCVGHPLGYNAARAILLSNARLSSESYAGVAMAKIRGIAAYEDLRKILFGDNPRKICTGAVYGMARAPSPQFLHDLFDAYKEGRLSRNDVSWHAASCNPTDEWLLTLLGSCELQYQRLACAIVGLMSSPNSDHRIPGRKVANAIRSLLNDETFVINRRRHKNLLTWLNST